MSTSKRKAKKRRKEAAKAGKKAVGKPPKGTRPPSGGKKRTAPAKTLADRKTRTLSVEKLGLTNTDQRSPTVYVDALDTGVKPAKRRGGHIILSDEMVTFDHDKAIEYIDLPVFPGERLAGDQHVNHLLDLERNNEFLWEIVQLASAILDDDKVRYKINGQHTAWMRVHLPAGKSATVREIVFRARDKKELGEIYRKFDTNKNRDVGHQGKVDLILSEIAPEVPRGKLTNIRSGFRFWTFESQKETARVTVGMLTALITEQESLFAKVGVFACNAWKESKIMLRKPVLAAMFETFDTRPTIAPAFWTPVSDGCNIPSKTDGRHRLRDVLDRRYSKVIRAGTRGDDVVRTWSDEDIYRVCLVAWNRWRKDEKVHILKPTKTRMKAL